jgi:hypothetical protein
MVLKAASQCRADGGLFAAAAVARDVDEMNRLTQPIQDKILKETQLDGVLGGVSA